MPVSIYWLIGAIVVLILALAIGGVRHHRSIKSLKLQEAQKHREAARLHLQVAAMRLDDLGDS